LRSEKPGATGFRDRVPGVHLVRREKGSNQKDKETIKKKRDCKKEKKKAGRLEARPRSIKGSESGVKSKKETHARRKFASGGEQKISRPGTRLGPFRTGNFKIPSGKEGRKKMTQTGGQKEGCMKRRGTE